MLISNSIIRGTAISNWLTTSGVGVRTAAIIKLISIAYFLFFLKKLLEISPIFERKVINSGSSKMTPNDNNSLTESEKYSFAAGNGSRKELVYPVKKRNAGGKTTK